MHALDGNTPLRPPPGVRRGWPPYLLAALAALAAALTANAWAQTAPRSTDIGATPTPTATMKIDGFLKVPDIPGESADDAHSGEIELLSWSWGVDPGTPTRAYRSVPSQTRVLVPAAIPRQGPGELSVTRRVDAHSPVLREALATGRHFAKVRLTLPPETPGTSPMTVTLENVAVTSYQTSSGDAPVRDARRLAARGGRAELEEEIAFAFKKITWH